MLGCTLNLPDYLARLNDEMKKIDHAPIHRLADQILSAWEDERMIFVIGNGGSALNASHIAEDIGKCSLPDEALFDESRKRVKILSLTDNVGWLLAIGNDLGYDQIFVQQLMNFARPGDLLIGLSSSGDSASVLQAIHWANRHDIATFGFSGYDGGELKRIQQDGFHIPVDDTGVVEGIQLCVWHWIFDEVYARINKVGRYAE